MDSQEIIMVIRDAKIVSGDKRSRTVSGFYIGFLSNDPISKGTYLSMNYNGKSHHFKVSDVEILGENLLVSAREVGYYKNKFDQDSNFDLRSIIGSHIVLVSDANVIKQINEQSSWC